MPLPALPAFYIRLPATALRAWVAFGAKVLASQALSVSNAKGTNKHNKSEYSHEIATRWSDNNGMYHNWFDTVINYLPIAHHLFDRDHCEVIRASENQGNYLVSVAFPDPVCTGLRASQLENSSVRYAIGLFRGDDSMTVAQRYFVYVCAGRGRIVWLQFPVACASVLQTLQIE